MLVRARHRKLIAFVICHLKVWMRYEDFAPGFPFQRLFAYSLRFREEPAGWTELSKDSDAATGKWIKADRTNQWHFILCWFPQLSIWVSEYPVLMHRYDHETWHISMLPSWKCVNAGFGLFNLDLLMHARYISWWWVYTLFGGSIAGFVKKKNNIMYVDLAKAAQKCNRWWMMDAIM